MLDMIASFILSVLASVVAYYICKWLDEEIQAVASLRINPPALKTEQKTPSAGTLGVFVLTTNHDRDNIFCLEVVYHIPLAKSSICKKFSFNSQSSRYSSRIVQYLQQSPKVNGFHEPDTWSRSFKVMYNKKEHKRNLRSLVRRRNHCTEGLSQHDA